MAWRVTYMTQFAVWCNCFYINVPSQMHHLLRLRIFCKSFVLICKMSFGFLCFETIFAPLLFYYLKLESFLSLSFNSVWHGSFIFVVRSCFSTFMWWQNVSFIHATLKVLFLCFLIDNWQLICCYVIPQFEPSSFKIRRTILNLLKYLLVQFFIIKFNFGVIYSCIKAMDYSPHYIFVWSHLVQ